MMILGIILGVILLILAMIGVGGSIQDKNRKKRCQSWKVGDKLALCRGKYNDILEHRKKEYAILKGWDLENLYIDCGDDMVYKVNWSVMEFNKSDTWRKNYENAKKVMGINPGFSGCIGDESETIGKKVNGKPIEVLSEIECEVQLKLAIEKEDYDLADKIRKRMEKFR
jgi:hypothetical protein